MQKYVKKYVKKSCFDRNSLILIKKLINHKIDLGRCSDLVFIISSHLFTIALFSQIIGATSATVHIVTTGKK